MKIIAFAGSNSRNSLNKQLVTYTVSLFENADTEILDLNDYEMPIYSIDRQKENGFPQPAHDFLAKIESADLLVMSFAEHNGNYSVAFKNILDWCSRINVKVFQQKPVLLMATSPGARGGRGVLDVAENNLPRHDAEIKAVFSLPSFNDNFDKENGRISNSELDQQLRDIVEGLK
jgi:chromate reductase